MITESPIQISQEDESAFKSATEMFNSGIDKLSNAFNYNVRQITGLRMHALPGLQGMSETVPFISFGFEVNNGRVPTSWADLRDMENLPVGINEVVREDFEEKGTSIENPIYFAFVVKDESGSYKWRFPRTNREKGTFTYENGNDGTLIKYFADALKSELGLSDGPTDTREFKAVEVGEHGNGEIVVETQAGGEFVIYRDSDIDTQATLVDAVPAVVVESEAAEDDPELGVKEIQSVDTGLDQIIDPKTLKKFGIWETTIDTTIRDAEGKIVSPGEHLPVITNGVAVRLFSELPNRGNAIATAEELGGIQTMFTENRPKWADTRFAYFKDGSWWIPGQRSFEDPNKITFRKILFKDELKSYFSREDKNDKRTANENKRTIRKAVREFKKSGETGGYGMIESLDSLCKLGDIDRASIRVRTKYDKDGFPLSVRIGVGRILPVADSLYLDVSKTVDATRWYTRKKGKENGLSMSLSKAAKFLKSKSSKIV